METKATKLQINLKLEQMKGYFFSPITVLLPLFLIQAKHN
jgi:hypothetical protein